MTKIYSALIISLLLFSCSKQTEVSDNLVKEEIALPQLSTGIYKTISAEDFKAKIATNQGLILDVRTDREVAKGVIKGAKQADFFGNFEQAILQFDKQTPVYVYCAAGGRSKKAMDKLQAAGFQEVYDLEGGMTNWQSLGFPVVEFTGE